MSNHQNRNSITISVFPAVSKPGEELYRLLMEKMKDYCIKGYPVKLTKRNYNMESALEACFCDDVVIFDGSIEDEVNKQYYGALELMKSLDYVLIVSRTFLPYNFEGMRNGGAPQMVLTGTTEYCEQISNSQILKWIIDTLEKSNMELPRSLKQNESWQELRKDEKHVAELVSKMSLLSQERMNQNFHREKVFVSYLSRYSKYYKGTSSSFPNVERIFGIISRESKVALEDIQYFPPGKISLELMTKQRRFEIVQLTEPYVAGCKEFWIYETPDYDSSWWTYGEKLSLVHIYKDHMDKCPDICVATPVKNESGQWVIKIRRYSTVEEKKRFLPALTEEQKQLMEIIYVNSSLDTVAYEQVETMQKLSEVPKELLKLWIRLNRKSFVDYMRQISFWLPANEQNELTSQTLDIQSLVESAKSTVYSKDFWGNHVVECPACRARLKYALNPETFYSFDRPYYFSISSEQYQEIKKLWTWTKNTVLHCHVGILFL